MHPTNLKQMNKTTPNTQAVSVCLHLAACEPIKEDINVNNYHQLFKICKNICKKAGVPKPFKQHKMCIVYESASNEKKEVTDDDSLQAAYSQTS